MVQPYFNLTSGQSSQVGRPGWREYKMKEDRGANELLIKMENSHSQAAAKRSKVMDPFCADDHHTVSELWWRHTGSIDVGHKVEGSNSFSVESRRSSQVVHDGHHIMSWPTDRLILSCIITQMSLFSAKHQAQDNQIKNVKLKVCDPGHHVETGRAIRKLHQQLAAASRSSKSSDCVCLHISVRCRHLLQVAPHLTTLHFIFTPCHMSRGLVPDIWNKRASFKVSE